MTNHADADQAATNLEPEAAAPTLTIVETPPDAEPSPLETAGFLALRGSLFNGAQAIEAIPLETLDRLIDFAERTERRARLRGATRPELDGLDTDLNVLKACRHLRTRLKEIGENAAARQKLAGPGPVAG